MTVKKTTAFLVALTMLLLCFAACDNSSKADITGGWHSSYIQETPSGPENMTATLIINEDGLCELHYSYNIVEGTWRRSTDGNSIEFNWESGHYLYAQPTTVKIESDSQGICLVSVDGDYDFTFHRLN